MTLSATDDRTMRPGQDRLISVIIPVYNAAPYLDQAVQSVLNQTHRDWELLLIEDGSTDGSDQLIQHWTQQYPDRIRYLHHPHRANRGMSASRNLGLKEAKGRYVAFLDADDVWLPEKLQEQFELLKAHPSAVMSYGPLTRWYSWTHAPQDADRDYVMDLGVPSDTQVDPPDLFAVFVLNEGLVPSNGLLLRSAALEVGGYEERFRGMYEDQAFHAKLCLRYPVYAAGKSWVLYRQHPASCCHVTVSEGRHRQTKIEFLEWLMDYLHQQGITDPHVNRLVHDQWLPLHRPTWARWRERLRSVGRQILPSSVLRRLRRRPDKLVVRGESVLRDTGQEVRA